MLKRKITKDVFDKLGDELKAFYEEKNGSYLLKVEGSEDDPADELRRANDRIKQENKELKANLKEINDKLEEASGLDAKKRGDIETLEKSWKEKLDKAALTSTATIDKLKGVIKKTLVDGTADSVAAKISTVPALMSKAVRERLTVDFDGDEPALRILDGTGKPSALSIDDLSKEFLANKEFSSIIVGSKASGSGASKDTQQRGNGGAPLDANGQPKDFRAMSLKDKVAHIQQQKASNE